MKKTSSKRRLEGIEELAATVQGVLVVEGRSQNGAQAPIQVTLRFGGTAVGGPAVS